MKRGIILIVILLLLSGCMGSTFVFPIKKKGKNYEINKIYTSNTGSPMIKVNNFYVLPEYRAIYTYHPCLPPDIKAQSDTDKMPAITPDQKWIAFYKQQDYYIIQSDSYPKRYGIKIKQNGELSPRPWVRLTDYQGFKWYQSQKRPGLIDIYNKYPEELSFSWELSNGKLFEETKGYMIKSYQDPFKAELIYTGKANNIITLSYREYINNMARPAFYQELKYDLSEGNDITFKSLKIKVLKTTNSKISFQVIDDDGLNWIPE